MNEYLERLEKLLISKDQEKLKSLLLEVKTSIDVYAELSDYLKRQHFSWNKRTEELCVIREMVTKQIKQMETDDEN